MVIRKEMHKPLKDETTIKTNDWYINPLAGQKQVIVGSNQWRKKDLVEDRTTGKSNIGCGLL